MIPFSAGAAPQFWTMPEWMEPYRELIINTGGNPIEELVNDHSTTAQVNLIRAALIVSVTSQVQLLTLLHDRGMLPELARNPKEEESVSDIELDEKLPQAEKIAKLLHLAENTENQFEADSFNERAQALMVKYAITERLVALAQGKEVPDKVIETTITYNGIFHMGLFNIGRAIAVNNNARHMIITHPGKTQSDLVVIGFESDVSNIKVLNASVQVQASMAMQRWYREQDITGRTAMQKSKMRREFLFGFAIGLNDKLRQANAAGQEQAVAAETERTGDADAAKVSTDLVIRTKKEQVDDWMDARYGQSLRSVRRNYTSGGYAARAAGTAAGRNANIGQPGIGGKRELGR